MPEHDSIQNADTHEPKHITDTLVSDAGKVITPSDTSAGTSELRKLTGDELNLHSQHSGEMVITNNTISQAITAAADPTLATNSDYIQVINFSSEDEDGITHASNALTVAKNGFYIVNFYANVKASVNSTTVGFKFAINGVISLNRRPKAFLRNAGEIHNVSGVGLAQLSASDVVTLWMAADNTNNTTIEDSVLILHLIHETV